MENILPQVYSTVSLLVLFPFIVLLGKLVNDFVTPYSVDHELATHDNLALSISVCGYILGITIIFIGAVLGPSTGSIVEDLLSVGGYSLLGILLLNVARIVNDKLILYKFRNYKEIIEDRNSGTGVVQFGSYVGSAFIVAGAIHGEGGGVITAVVFFLLGQLILVIVAQLYNLVTPYDIHSEVEDDNVAAGTAFSGTLIAVGIILMKGSSGNFISWSHNMTQFAIETAIALVILPIFRIVLDKIIIRKVDLNHEIHKDRNLGAGILEMSMVTGFATVLFFLY